MTPAPAWPVELPQRGPGHGAAGRLALAGLVVLLLATLAFLVRACAPAEPSSSAPVRPATPEPARPRSGAPAVTAAVAPTLPPTSPAQTAAGSPVDTIRQHYALIDARRYADGYALMDARLRRLNSPAEYAGWFANKVSVTPLSIELVSQTDTQAVVRSVVQTTDRINGQEVTTQVAEQFVLRNEDGAWRIDQVSRL
jgi:hypothetical protein